MVKVDEHLLKLSQN